MYIASTLTYKKGYWLNDLLTILAYWFNDLLTILAVTISPKVLFFAIPPLNFHFIGQIAKIENKSYFAHRFKRVARIKKKKLRNY